VAGKYLKLLDKLSVSISLPKSLVSDNGTLEFAKRYWTKGLQKDLSPVSLKALLTVRSTLGLCALADRYKVSFNTLARLARAGFRVRATLLSTRSRRWERLWAAASKPPIGGAHTFRVLDRSGKPYQSLPEGDDMCLPHR
jgi:hypothetical protein